jgi:chemotaxis protein MotB
LGLHPEDLAEEVAQKLITFSENEASIILEQLAFKEDKVAKSGIEIKEDERGLIIQIAAPLLFDGGSHSIKPSAEKLLSKICRILRTVEGLNNRPLRIEGHADYIKFAGSNSNWELSVWRSISVLRYMIYEGIDRNRLSAVGYGDTKTLPRKPNEPDYEWNQRNRRVEIVVLREKTKK